MAGYAGTAYAEAPYGAPAAPPGPVGPPEGRLSGRAPAVTGSFSATATVQPIDATLTGTAPSVTGSFSGGMPDAVTGSLAGQAPAVFGSFAASHAAPATIIETATTYANDGSNSTSAVPS